MTHPVSEIGRTQSTEQLDAEDTPPSWRVQVKHALSPIIYLSVFLAGMGTHTIITQHLYYNLTPSEPLGLYWLSAITPHDLSHDMRVVLTPPEHVLTHLETIAPDKAWRHPWLKRIAALPDDSICVVHDRVTVNGRPASDRVAATAALFPEHYGCIVLKPGQIYVLNTHPRSMDSRYLGPMHASWIRGKATALITWNGK